MSWCVVGTCSISPEKRQTDATMPKQEAEKIEKLAGHACFWLNEGQTDNNAADKTGSSNDQKGSQIQMQRDQIAACRHKQEHADYSRNSAGQHRKSTHQRQYLKSNHYRHKPCSHTENEQACTSQGDIIYFLDSWSENERTEKQTGKNKKRII